MKEINVLYIDDEKINLEVFVASFRKKFNVFVALSAKEGEVILTKEQIHVVISDQRMPEKSGNAFLEEVREDYPHIVRIILTAYADYETASESINRGSVFRFIQKPWSYEEIVEAITEGYKIYSLTKRNAQLLTDYRFLFDFHPMPIFIIDKEAEIVIKANEKAKTYYSPNKALEGEKMESFFDMSGALSSEQGMCLVKRADGEIRTVRLVVKEVEWEDTERRMVLVDDQTEVLNFENRKTEYMLQVQEREKKRLSMELHDNIAQELVLLKLYVEESLQVKENELNNFMNSYNRIVNSIRDLSFGLNPPDLENGFSLAVEKLFERLNRMGKISFIYENNDLKRTEQIISKNAAYQLYRIIQEFINNSIKHAVPTQVSCRIKVENGFFKMILEDNGRGFDISKASLGDGLNNIQMRSTIANFQYLLESEINKGTRLKLSLKILE